MDTFSRNLGVFPNINNEKYMISSFIELTLKMGTGTLLLLR